MTLRRFRADRAQGAPAHDARRARALPGAGLPVVMLLLFGYARLVRHRPHPRWRSSIRTARAPRAQLTESLGRRRRVRAAGARSATPEEAEPLFRRGRVKAVLVMPRGYQRDSGARRADRRAAARRRQRRHDGDHRARRRRRHPATRALAARAPPRASPVRGAGDPHPLQPRDALGLRDRAGRDRADPGDGVGAAHGAGDRARVGARQHGAAVRDAGGARRDHPGQALALRRARPRPDAAGARRSARSCSTCRSRARWRCSSPCSTLFLLAHARPGALRQRRDQEPDRVVAGRRSSSRCCRRCCSAASSSRSPTCRWSLQRDLGGRAGALLHHRAARRAPKGNGLPCSRREILRARAGSPRWSLTLAVARFRRRLG